jgi:hypothetical protein
MQVPASFEGLKYRQNQDWLHVTLGAFDLNKGDSVRVLVTVKGISRTCDCRVAALEPFGAGLEVQPREIRIGSLDEGQQLNLEFLVKAKRSNEVNLNHPWELNLVLTSESAWASHLISFNVRDKAEGRIFLVLTNDHEPRPRAGKDLGQNRIALEPETFEQHLVQNGEVANELAERHGLIWTHMLDAGGAVALPLWASAKDKKWRSVWDKAQSHYLSAAVKGHDFQVHLHLSAMPNSPFFCYGYDGCERALVFDMQRRHILSAGKKINSWANVTRNYGRKENANSRAGSLLRAKQIIGSALSSVMSPYRPVLFRAGQWDLGSNLADREKSVLALRENGILADSSLTNNDHYIQGELDYGKPPHNACYFTQYNDPSRVASTLREIGLLEVLPILQPQGRRPVTPRDNPSPVIYAYESFTEKGRIKPGRHCILEIEHLSTVGETPRHKPYHWPSTERDWFAMSRHFASVRRECPQLEGVGASEAIYAWLDYYSPELLVRITSPVTELSSAGETQVSRFSLQFLGEGILTDEQRTYELQVPIPQLSWEGAQILRVLSGGKAVLEQEVHELGQLSVKLDLSTHNRHDFALEIESCRSRVECKGRILAPTG